MTLAALLVKATSKSVLFADPGNQWTSSSLRFGGSIVPSLGYASRGARVGSDGPLKSADGFEGIAAPLGSLSCAMSLTVSDVVIVTREFPGFIACACTVSEPPC